MSQRASTVEELWERAEEALEASSKRAEGLLTQLASAADEGSDASLFAHRHLAELHLEDNPWKSALHLRRVLGYCADDDVVHALMGLCHALLGNYRVAVRSYREASTLAPQTPWYHHNLGHLMDVALDDPAAPNITFAERTSSSRSTTRSLARSRIVSRASVTSIMP